MDRRYKAALYNTEDIVFTHLPEKFKKIPIKKLIDIVTTGTWPVDAEIMETWKQHFIRTKEPFAVTIEKNYGRNSYYRLWKRDVVEDTAYKHEKQKL